MTLLMDLLHRKTTWDAPYIKDAYFRSFFLLLFGETLHSDHNYTIFGIYSSRRVE
jgi:hypothetical protein